MKLEVSFLSDKSRSLLERLAEKTNFKFLIYGGLVRDYIRKQLGEGVEGEPDADIFIVHDDFDEAMSILSNYTKALFPAFIKERTIRIVVGGDEAIDATIIPTSTDLTLYPFDFTVNTFYCDGRTLLKEGEAEIYTPFEESWQDIKNKILRAPNPQWLISEPFGAVRGIRLYSQLSYEFAKETREVYKQALAVAKREISPLLIVREFARAVSSSLARFAKALVLCGGDEILFAPLHKLFLGDYGAHVFAACKAYDELIKSSREDTKFWKLWQRRKEKLVKTLEGVKMGVSKHRNLLNMVGFAVLLHDIGKVVKEDGHEVIGARLVSKITEDLSFFPNERWIVYWLVRYHMKVHEVAHGNKEAFDWFRSIKEDLIKKASLLLALADISSKNPAMDVEETYAYDLLFEAAGL